MKKLALAAAALTLATAVHAQVPQYGPNVTLDQARRIAAAAEAEATRNKWPVAIAIVDTAGLLVYYQRADQTQTGSVQIAQDKARTAAMYRRSTKVLQDAVAGGGAGLRFLRLGDTSPIEGGLPIVVDGKIAGGIGVSGVNSDQDGVVAAAGLAALK